MSLSHHNFNTDNRSLQINKVLAERDQKLAQKLSDILQQEWNKSCNEKKPLDFSVIYPLVTAYRMMPFSNLKLSDIRTTEGYTLLHLMVNQRNIAAVKQLVNGKSNCHIPRNVSHVSTNHLLHFCGLWSSKENDSNKDMIKIMEILSDANAPDAIPLDPLKAPRHKDGGTHAHAAALSGALDVLLFINKHCGYDVFTIQRNDKRAVIDLAVHMKHGHIIANYNIRSPSPLKRKFSEMEEEKENHIGFRK